MIQLTTPSGTPITSYHQWTRPKRDFQWKAGRSAMELARSWFRDKQPAPPDEFLALLHASTRLHNIKIISGIPELITHLPERGEGRNHDLALVANTPKDQITITIEAKADEPFGSDSVLGYYEKAIKRRNSGTPTRVPERIEQLLTMVDSGIPVHESKWKDIRYQLLTALCGTVLQARMDGSDLAVLVIHEFQSDETDTKKQKENHKDLELFMAVLTGSNLEIQPGKMYTGMQVDGVDIMVGKVITFLQGEL